MIVFFSIFFVVYAAINYYIFIRGWQALSGYAAIKPFYLVIFLISALSYFISKIFGEYLPAILYDIILAIGSFWFAYILYLFLSIVLIDLIRLINWKTDFFPQIIKGNYDASKFVVFLVVFFLVSVVIFFGYLNTRNIKINTYDLEIKKGKSTLSELNLVMAADFHLSPLNNGKLLKDIIIKINSLNPDIVLLPGDIVDDKPSILKLRNIGTDFDNVRSKYGVIASNGNHEFISGINMAVLFMQEHGIHVLRDTAVLIDNSFYIVGREDRSKDNFTDTKRKSLQEIMSTIEPGYPVILLDHSPFQLEEAQKNNVDLQLSGHTHDGQVFPASLITEMVYELSWGYLKKGNTQYFVTCGVGTWGPPVRIGSDSEIVNLKIKFVD